MESNRIIMVPIEVPETATHYWGDLRELATCTFAKCVQIGVVGDHWFEYKNNEWVLYSHSTPYWIKELPK